MRLADKVAIITGGGSGMGKATAHLFAREGAKVVIAQRTDSQGEETAAAINSSGGEAIFIHTDVALAAQVERLMMASLDKFGKIDILFNNAGVGLKPTPVEDIDEVDWDRIYAVNVRGVFLGGKYAVPVMKKAGSGVIINNASIGAVRPRAQRSAYASSKAAVIMLTKALALELAPNNIRVNCINPVFTDTPFISRVVPEGRTLEEHKKAIGSTIPLGRIAEPEDIAYAALYLASDEASMVTGICLDVDGGRGI